MCIETPTDIRVDSCADMHILHSRHMRRDMRVDMRMDIHMDMRIGMRTNMLIGMHIDMRIGMGTGMHIDIHIDMRIDMCTDMRTDMCIDMRIDMCIDMCRASLTLRLSQGNAVYGRALGMPSAMPMGSRFRSRGPCSGTAAMPSSPRSVSNNPSMLRSASVSASMKTTCQTKMSYVATITTLW